MYAAAAARPGAAAAATGGTPTSAGLGLKGKQASADNVAVRDATESPAEGDAAARAQVASAAGGAANRADRVEGTRTHELLANLDAAKKQKLQNEKLRNMVLDTEELSQKVHQQQWLMKPRAELKRLHKKSEEMMKEYKRQLSYSHLKKFNVSRYMTACAQEMQVRELTSPDSQPDIAPVNAVIMELGRLREQQNINGQKYFDYVLTSGADILSKVTTLLADSKLQGERWTSLTAPVLTLLRDVMNQSGVQSALGDLEEQCRRIEFEVDEVTELQTVAVEKGDMDSTEALYYRKITLQEALADLTTKKFDVIDSVAEEVFKRPLKRVHEVHAQANADIHALLRENETLKTRCETDLASLTTEIERVNMEDYNETKQNQIAIEKLHNTFRENLLQQDVCWAEMERLEREMCALGQQRADHAKELVRTLEQEEKRQVEYQYFAHFTSQHKVLLELTIHNCELAEEITDSVDEFISAHCNAVEHRMRDLERDLEDVRLEVHQAYLSHFRTMYLTLGDLQYKKEAHVASLEEKIQVAHMQQEMHMESLNPKAKEFSQLKRDLQGQKSDLESQVGTLRQKSTLYIEAFKPTEQALIEAGRPFEHPVETLHKMNESRKLKLIAYHQLVSGEGGEAELENERRVIEQLKTSGTYTSHALRIEQPGAASTGSTPHDAPPA